MVISESIKQSIVSEVNSQEEIALARWEDNKLIVDYKNTLSYAAVKKPLQIALEYQLILTEQHSDGLKTKHFTFKYFDEI